MHSLNVIRRFISFKNKSWKFLIALKLMSMVDQETRSQCVSSDDASRFYTLESNSIKSG